jgi:transcriptional regulator with XRE-family HTH domain
MEYNVYKKIPNLLRKYRKVNGFKQQDVAEILGMKSTSKISRWEKGECIPNMVNAFRISILYCVMVDSLFIDLLHELRKETKKRMDEYLQKKKTPTH